MVRDLFITRDHLSGLVFIAPILLLEIRRYEDLQRLRENKKNMRFYELIVCKVMIERNEQYHDP